MREINAQLITDKVAELCIDANCSLPCDIRKRIEDARANEPWATAQGILDKIIENYNIADENRAPICQDKLGPYRKKEDTHTVNSDPLKQLAEQAEQAGIDVQIK